MKKYIVVLLCSILCSCAQPLYKTSVDTFVYKNINKTDSILLRKNTFWIQISKFGKRNRLEEINIVDTSKIYRRNKSLSIGSWRFVQNNKAYLQSQEAIKLKEKSSRAVINNKNVNAVPRPKYVELVLGAKVK